MKHTVEKYMALRERVDKAHKAADAAYERLAKLRDQLQQVTDETNWDAVLLDYKGVNYILYMDVKKSWNSKKRYGVKEVKEVQ